jgi:uncharacterized protein YciI
MYFAVIYEPGPNRTERGSEPSQPLDGHIRHQQEQLRKGVLVMGGPFSDRPGGMAVFEAETQEEIESILAADPSIQEGYYTATIYPWRVVSRREAA